MGVTVPYYKYFNWNEYVNYNDQDYLDGNIVCMIDDYEGILKRWEGNRPYFQNHSTYNYLTKIGNGVSGVNLFSGYSYFNKPVKIPNTITSYESMFLNCSRFNQPVTIPNKSISYANMFRGCYQYTQDIIIPSKVTSCINMLYNARPKNVYINCVGRTEQPNLYGLLGNSQSANVVNVYCNNLSYINGTNVFSMPNNSIVYSNSRITWAATTNGYYNATYNVYIYNNYTG